MALNLFQRLIGTLSGIRGAFARFFRGATSVPTVSSLAGQIRRRIAGMAVHHSVDAAARLIGARQAAERIGSSLHETVHDRAEIPKAPLFDIPGIQPGDVVSEVLVTTRGVDGAGGTVSKRNSAIIVITGDPTRQAIETMTIDVAQDKGYIGGGIIDVTVAAIDILWTFVVGD